MKKDVMFEGLIGVLVSLLFIGVSQIEIPFYPIESEVQLFALACLAASLVVIVVGYTYSTRYTRNR